MLHIVRDDLTSPAIHALLEEHLRHMHETSPPESVHALDLAKLRAPEITFWSAWLHDTQGETLMGCGAIKELDPRWGELKSMRTPEAQRGKGAGRAMLEHLLAVARERGYERLSLETGSMDAFLPARTLYASVGFTPCGPFGDYAPDPNSTFMTLRW